MADTVFSRIQASRTADDVVHQIESLILEGFCAAVIAFPANASLRASSTFPAPSCAMR